MTVMSRAQLDEFLTSRRVRVPPPLPRHRLFLSLEILSRLFLVRWRKDPQPYAPLISFPGLEITLLGLEFYTNGIREQALLSVCTFSLSVKILAPPCGCTWIVCCTYIHFCAFLGVGLWDLFFAGFHCLFMSQRVDPGTCWWSFGL